MSKLLVILGLIALAILAFLCINKHSPEIEDDLVARTQQVLDADNKGFVKIGVDGRDLILMGIAPDEVFRERAGELARGIKGVRVVDNQLTLSQIALSVDTSNIPPIVTPKVFSQAVSGEIIELEPIPYYEVKEPQPLKTHRAKLFPIVSGSYHTEISNENGRVTLSGMAADESSHLWLVNRAKEQFGDQNIDDQMKVVYGAPQGWHATVSAAMQSIGNLSKGQAILSGNELTIKGYAASPRIFDQIKELITEKISDHYIVSYNIDAQEPDTVPTFVVEESQPLGGDPAIKMPSAINNYQTEIIYDSGKVILKGHVPDQAARIWLTDLAKEKIGKDNVTDSMTYAVGAPRGWYSTMGAVLSNLTELEKGKASLNNSDLIVSGYASSIEIKSLVEKMISGDVSHYATHYNITAPSAQMSGSRITCQQKFNNLLKNKRILFDSDKAEIKSESFVLLDQLAYVAAKECPGSKVEIAGHTDDRGDEVYNQYLSELRAKSVVNYLREKGVASKNLKAAGYGELRPIADNSTPKGLIRNRRIEFNVQGK